MAYAAIVASDPAMVQDPADDSSRWYPADGQRRSGQDPRKTAPGEIKQPARIRRAGRRQASTLGGFVATQSAALHQGTASSEPIAPQTVVIRSGRLYVLQLNADGTGIRWAREDATGVIRRQAKLTP